MNYHPTYLRTTAPIIGRETPMLTYQLMKKISANDARLRARAERRARFKHKLLNILTFWKPNGRRAAHIPL